MGRSQRANRDDNRFGEDRYGDAHYPGTGAPAAAATVNPALERGGQADYAYDWPNTWDITKAGTGAPQPTAGKAQPPAPSALPDTAWTKHADADAWYAASGLSIAGWEGARLEEKYSMAQQAVAG